ncbi:hypothetical protein [Streptomyces sirii]|uniref:hypothetical protein n=1 Tax=Streptomyces sirii TaxID=3127701 RepID=UPI003D364568
MSTTSDRPDDSQPRGESEPHTHDASPVERARTQDPLAWTALGLTGVLCTSGAVLVHTGHTEAGVDLIKAGIAAAGIGARK